LPRIRLIAEENPKSRATVDDGTSATPLPGPLRRKRTELSGEFRALRPTLIVVGLIIVGVIAAAVIGWVTYSPTPVGDVPVALRDYTITMPSVLKPGHHTFAVSNDGKTEHEFVVFRTDLSSSALPIDKDQNVDEESSLLTGVADSGSSLKPGQTRGVPTTTNLQPGHYVAVCNLPAHYRLGMSTDFTVSG
jgi:uncharacterized cupredoxin-like copper-binding protein